MAEKNTIEDVERVELPGSKDSDQDNGADDSSEDTSNGVDGEQDSEKGAEKPPVREPQEQIVKSKPTEPEGKKEDVGVNADEDSDDDKKPKPVEGETPKERALRQKIEKMEAENRKRFAGEIKIGEGAPESDKKELLPDKQAILKKYKPEEIAALEEVLPVIAEKNGYVRGEQLASQTYATQSQDILDEFLKEHKEYMPEQDKDGLLWNRFKEEFGMYRQPKDPRDYRKIFNRIHTDIFGIKPQGDKGTITAAQRKIQVASHAGASGPNRPTVSSRPRTNTSGLRMDMLKGFSDEEKAEMAGGDEDE